MVVAHQREHAAARRGAREIGVAEDVAAAVDARSLAVPEPEHAVEPALAAHLRLLRAPDRGRRELLVEARLEMDVVGLEQVLQPRELQIEAADRRAAVAGDEAAGVEPGATVALLLRDQQPRDRLRARQQHRRLRRGRNDRPALRRRVPPEGPYRFYRPCSASCQSPTASKRASSAQPPVSIPDDWGGMCSELDDMTSRRRGAAFHDLGAVLDYGSR